jgi:hypothetical protein
VKSSTLAGSVRLIPIRGGIGNQLFQSAGILYLRSQGYTAFGFFPGRSARGVHSDKHEVLLKALGVPLVHNRPLESILGLAIRVNDEVNSLLSTVFGKRPDPRAFDSVSEIIQIAKRSVVVSRYFQNPELVDKTEIVDRLSEVLRSDVDNPCILHIRGGDYLKAKKLFGEVGEEYFLSAIQKLGITGTITVMSDDQEYASRVVRGFSNRVEFSGLPVLSEFELAINSHYFIGTNSTLSWWIARIRSRLERPSCLPSLFTPPSSFFHSDKLPNRLPGVLLLDPRFSD